METIVLRSDLLEALQQNANQQARSVNDLVNEAVARYVGDLQSDQLTREIEAYEAQHAKLKQNYPNQWIAMQGGRVVDHDAERAELHRRTRARYGQTPVLIRQVREAPDDDLRWRGGSLRGLRA